MAYTESNIVEATLLLQGNWLQDPLDAEGTARRYLYGGSASAGAVEVGAVEALYAGRTFPVVDFGPHQRESVKPTVHVPFGPGWTAQVAELRAFAMARRPLLFRDGRGRSVLASMADYAERDERWGTSVTFTMARVEGAWSA